MAASSLTGAQRLKTLAYIYPVLAAVVVGACALIRVGPVSLPLLVMLPALALLAEFLPVEISRRGLRVTFTVPFIGGMAAAFGPLGALLTDAAVTLVSALAGGRRRPKWLLLNLSVSVTSSGTAGLLFIGVLYALQGTSGAATVASLAFAVSYTAINFLMVAAIDSAISGRTMSEGVLSSYRTALQGLAVYCLLSIAVTVFVVKGHYALVPLTLVPVWALRTVLVLKTRMFEHYYETITALAMMLQRAHPYTHGHLERVAKISEEVALRLGLPSDRARLVREAAVLHDIGKIAVDEEILDKPARLTDEEFAHVRRHSAFGAQILSPVGGFHEMVPWIRHHHERPDGNGYPDGLSDVEIPIESKIIAVVDAYDAMTGGENSSEKRTYRDPMPVDDAIRELERCSGSQFDARVVAAFREVVLGGYA